MYISRIETYTAVVVERARTGACLAYLVRIINIDSSGIIPTSRYSYLLRVLHPPCAVPAFVFSYRSRSTHGQLKSKQCLKLFKLHRHVDTQNYEIKGNKQVRQKHKLVEKMKRSNNGSSILGSYLRRHFASRNTMTSFIAMSPRDTAND